MLTKLRYQTVLSPLLLFAGLILAAGCGAEPITGGNMTFEVEPNPPAVGPSHLSVILTDDNGQPIDDATLKIEGAMDHDGMFPIYAQTRAEENGRYGTPFVWTMDGDWLMTVTANLPDGQVVERQFNLLVVNNEAAANDHDKLQPPRIPNRGAVVRLLSPPDGAVFAPGDDIEVAITTENFTLGDNGNHWHIYIDGRSPKMIMGHITTATLQDIEPGRHEISVYLSVGSHEDLEDGAAATITITGETMNDMAGHTETHNLTQTTN